MLVDAFIKSEPISHISPNLCKKLLNCMKTDKINKEKSDIGKPNI